VILFFSLAVPPGVKAMAVVSARAALAQMGRADRERANEAQPRSI